MKIHWIRYSILVLCVLATKVRYKYELDIQNGIYLKNDFGSGSILSIDFRCEALERRQYQNADQWKQYQTATTHQPRNAQAHTKHNAPIIAFRFHVILCGCVELNWGVGAVFIYRTMDV